MKQTQLPLTDEEKANVNLLEIIDGRLTGVSNPDKLVGSFVLPDCITEIGVYAFQNYNSLTSITIPDSVIKIGCRAFKDCTSLKNIVIYGSVAEYNISTFYCINPDAHFTVKNETEKKLLINSDNSIRDEQITVDPEL